MVFLLGFLSINATYHPPPVPPPHPKKDEGGQEFNMHDFDRHSK